LGYSGEFKLEPVESQTITNGPYFLTVDVSNSTFDWITNFPVSAVVVKGGPGGLVYDYFANGGPVMSDEGLHAPVNPKNRRYYGLSHVSFCWHQHH
jgi:hypothetical protein